MTGSLEDAEDCVQETMLRAWRNEDRFEGRATLRTWLYRIATNACLDLLRKRAARKMPESVFSPADSEQPVEPPDGEVPWLDPLPQHWLASAEADPAKQNIDRETVSLAFTVALQTLPARQRAALILQDVLDWRAKEVARLLETSPGAVNAMVQRARASLRSARAGDGKLREPEEGPQLRELLKRYVTAWEAADIEGLVRLLKDDVEFTMPPSPTWTRGREATRLLLAKWVFAGAANRYRLSPVSTNGRTGFAVYRLTGDGVTSFTGIQVLAATPGSNGPLLSSVATFMSPRLTAAFELPAQLRPEGG
jgi:RNA polymerase sigma-70 factor (ECF subfamily)